MTATNGSTLSLRGQHIAHIIESSGPGGAERMVAELARAQQQLGASTTVFLPRGREDWLAAQLKDCQVSVEYFDLTSPLSWHCVRSLGSAFKHRDITLAHSHEFTMAVNGALAARAAGIPHVITMHGGRYYAGKLRRRVLLRGAVASSQATVVVSDALGDALSRDLRVKREQILTIANGVRVNLAKAAALRAELKLNAKADIVLAVGNLYPVKGHAALIDALPQLPRSAHVVIAGRGAEEPALIARAAALGVSARLHLLGHREDVTALMMAADVFVQPSLDEGLPLAVLEAMFAARPIVATDVGDVAQAVGPDGALLVPPGDAPALGVAITRLLEQPFLASALAACARERATRNYGMTRAVGRYTEVYAPLLRPARASSPEPSLVSPEARSMASASTAAQRSMRKNTSTNTGSD